VAAFFYMHNDTGRLRLLEEWVKKWRNMQPLEEVRQYFGEKIALYFMWLGRAPPPPLTRQGTTRRCCGSRRWWGSS
jgi:hypothetical protein